MKLVCRSRCLSVILALLALILPPGVSAHVDPAVSISPAAQAPSGFRALSGAAAAGFALPADVELVRQLNFAAYGLTFERYQQRYGEAAVHGGQITLYRNPSRAITLVIGSHYPNITPVNTVRLGPADAAAAAEREFGPNANRAVHLMIDPANGRYFYRVENAQVDSRWVLWIDADSGAELLRYDDLQSEDGIGVKGDSKDLNGPDDANPADDLTVFHDASGHGECGAHWDLFSADSRQLTYNAQGTRVLFYATDEDNHWITPSQGALVDAQYYANSTDDYFLGRYGFNWGDCYSAQQSVAHFAHDYNNAFWNGTYTVYGDGDGVVFRPLSGGLDVVSHEHTHGVTECTSDLIYLNESGALNESFSDMLGNSAEFFVNESTASNCVLGPGQGACADWWIGEDVYVPADTMPGFRNMADPAEDDDPDHYSELLRGSDDNGFVHSNSGIPNHAYYLVVNGGRNAGEARGHAHSGPSVRGLGLAKAEQIFFLGFTGLPASATMCEARLATAAAARALFGPREASSTRDAWEAVGLTANLCGS